MNEVADSIYYVLRVVKYNQNMSEELKRSAGQGTVIYDVKKGAYLFADGSYIHVNNLGGFEAVQGSKDD